MQEERTYPFVNVQVVPEGMAIQIMLAPGLAVVQSLNEQTMHDIVKKWRELQKEKQNSLFIVRNNPVIPAGGKLK